MLTLPDRAGFCHLCHNIKGGDRAQWETLWVVCIYHDYAVAMILNHQVCGLLEAGVDIDREQITIHDVCHGKFFSYRFTGVAHEIIPRDNAKRLAFWVHDDYRAPAGLSHSARGRNDRGLVSTHQ